MNPMLLGPILEVGKTLLDRFIPDPEAKRQAELEMIRMAADGELKQTIAQLEINAREAAHPSVFVAGWRPAFGWCGAIGFLYSTTIQPMLAWYGAARGWGMPPAINIDLLWVVITGLLGIGSMRTLEKVQKVAK